MVSYDSKESGVARPFEDRFPIPPLSVPHASTPVDLALARWEQDIQRLAASWGAGSAAHPDDLAQVARIQLWHLFTNDLRRSDPYVRQVIRNAMRSEMRIHRTGPELVTWDDPQGCGDDENYGIAETYPDESALVAFERLDNTLVDVWVSCLSVRLQQLYELLYREGLTQKEAAGRMGVSQPRVAQFHRELLAQGGFDLLNLAA